MIGSLTGVVREVSFVSEHVSEVIVDVHGVGYRVVAASATTARLGGVGANVGLAIHTYVREGAITLYGFADPLERRTFELLITAHGIGPALGLAILATYPPAELAAIVAAEDADALIVVPGVGKKTAQRLIVELAERLVTVAPGALAPSGERRSARSGAQVEVGEALEALGYASDEIRAALSTLSNEGSVEELLRLALRELAPRR